MRSPRATLARMRRGGHRHAGGVGLHPGHHVRHRGPSAATASGSVTQSKLPSSITRSGGPARPPSARRAGQAEGRGHAQAVALPGRRRGRWTRPRPRPRSGEQGLAVGIGEQLRVADAPGGRPVAASITTRPTRPGRPRQPRPTSSIAPRRRAPDRRRPRSRRQGRRRDRFAQPTSAGHRPQGHHPRRPRTTLPMALRGRASTTRTSRGRL